MLYNLAQFMSSPHFSIFDDSDDHETDNYFLYSSHFEGNNSENEVYSAALGLIQLINGASAINIGFNDYNNRGDISVRKLIYSKTDQPRDENWHYANKDDNTPPSNPFIGKEDKSRHINPYSHLTTSLVELSLENEDVFNIVRQVAFGFDWRNLYCIWDTVSYYCGGSKKAISDLGLDEGKIKSFTGTVNNFEALGLDARHGVMGWKIPKKIVSHKDAIDIINEVVKAYLFNNYLVFIRKMKKEWV